MIDAFPAQSAHVERLAEDIQAALWERRAAAFAERVDLWIAWRVLYRAFSPIQSAHGTMNALTASPE